MHYHVHTLIMTLMRITNSNMMSWPSQSSLSKSIRTKFKSWTRQHYLIQFNACTCKWSRMVVSTSRSQSLAAILCSKRWADCLRWDSVEVIKLWCLKVWDQDVLFKLMVVTPQDIWKTSSSGLYCPQIMRCGQYYFLVQDLQQCHKPEAQGGHDHTVSPVPELPWSEISADIF